MRADKLWERALGLLGVGAYPSRMQTPFDISRMALGIINAVYSDLSRILGLEYKAIGDLSQTVLLPDSVLSEAFIYGLCAHISAILCDSDMQNYYGALYNAKRTGLSSSYNMADIFSEGESV